MLLIATVACIAVSSDSFWIDECWTADFATTSTLRECWNYMARMHFPEIQAPLYMAYIWSWVHLFGSAEWVMRAAGVPWFVGGSLVLVWYLRPLVASVMIPTLLVALSPFAWYYSNEARLYAMQLGFASAVIGSAIEIARNQTAGTPNRRALQIFAWALVGLCGSNVLGAVFGFVFFVVLLAGVRNGLKFLKTIPFTGAVTMALLLGLVGYYAWTRTVKPQASNVGTTTLQSLAFVAYELIGATGLGPARNALRSGGAAALKPYVPLLAVYVPLVVIVLAAGIRETGSRIGYRKLLVLVLCILSPVLLLAAVGMAIRFRMLGRHITPVLPAIWLVLAFGLTVLWRSGKRGKVIASSFYLFCIASCVSLRFAEQHKKDDYRGAAARAREAIGRGEVVWWNADEAGGRYYRVTTNHPTGANSAYVVANPNLDTLRSLPIPALIAASKPDNYDSQGLLAAFAREHNYAREELPAFTIYRRK
jgi:hypothetical protein